MPDSPAFETCAELLEKHTELNRLEARGTLRLALRECGFDPRRVRAPEVAAVVERALPQALESRGISDVEKACNLLLGKLEGTDDGEARRQHRPDDVFRRVVEGDAR